MSAMTRDTRPSKFPADTVPSLAGRSKDSESPAAISIEPKTTGLTGSQLRLWGKSIAKVAARVGIVLVLLGEGGPVGIVLVLLGEGGPVGIVLVLFGEGGPVGVVLVLLGEGGPVGVVLVLIGEGGLAGGGPGCNEELLLFDVRGSGESSFIPGDVLKVVRDLVIPSSRFSLLDPLALDVLRDDEDSTRCNSDEEEEEPGAVEGRFSRLFDLEGADV